jgi:hypothetical protein
MDINFLQTRSYKKTNLKTFSKGNVAQSYTNVVNPTNEGKQLNYNTLMQNLGKAIKETNTINNTCVVRTNYHKASRNTMGLLK